MIHCEKCGKFKIKYVAEHCVCTQCGGPFVTMGDHLRCKRCDKGDYCVCDGYCKKGCFKTAFEIILGGIIGGVAFNFFTNSGILILIGMVMGYVGIEMLIWWKSKPNTFTDPRDKKKYKYVKIGKQVWMAENLNYNEEGSTPSDLCEYGEYGRLYEFETAKKACPPGWHLPSKEEWETLLNFVGGDKIAGKKLKAKSDWQFHYIPGQSTYKLSGDGTDNYGFSALPSFISGFMGCWWSSSKCPLLNENDYYYLEMNHIDDEATLKWKDKYLALAVRCVKD